MPNLSLIAGDLGYSCYPADPRTLYADMFSKGVALQTSTLVGVLLQDAQPTAEQTGFVWVRTSGGAPVFPNPWIFYSGQWLAKHPVPANDQRLFLFIGAAADVDILDGGAAGAVSVNSGPFWVIDSAFATRMPVGVGTLPSGTVLGVGDTGGEEKHTLTAAELPTHTHRLPSELLEVTSGAINDQGVGKAVGSSGNYSFSNGVVSDDGSAFGLAGSSHQNMPLYKAVYFIKRTARTLCTSPIS